MAKINKSDLIKLQVLKAMRDLVKNGMYKSSIGISTNCINTLFIEVYCKNGVWTPYIQDYEPCGSGCYVGHYESEEEVLKILNKYTLVSFTVYHG